MAGDSSSNNKDRHHFYEPTRPSTINLTGFTAPKESEDDVEVASVSSNANPLIAAVEAGGTSFVVAICEVTSPHGPTILPTIVHRQEFDSSHDNPAQTLAECAAFLKQHKPPSGYQALGIASFGPLGVDPAKKDTYGKILGSSPKAAWRNVDLLTPLKQACQGQSSTRPLPVKVDTDVNAPAMAEHLLRKNKTFSSTAYITVGTGIGVGLVVHHKPVHGRMHPEGGHVPVQPLPGDTFGGYSWNDTSPFGGINTVEGLACSVALTERYQKLNPDLTSIDRSILKTLPDDHEVWDHAANALANLCATLFLTLSMEQIVLGGGLMNRNGLLEKIQQRTIQLLNGYLELPNIATIVRKSQFGSDAGLMGTIVLAQSAFRMHEEEDQPALTKEDEKKMKQVAFSSGLWHGMWVGMVGTALLCKYWWIPRMSSRR